jgi:hypothetical protein
MQIEVAMHRVYKAFLPALFVLLLFGILCSCQPSVKVEPPDKPITINLNVKIEHEIRVKVEKELDAVLSEESGLF